MHQPEFYRNDDVWDDDEERTRGRDPFPLAIEDITDIDADDVRLGYHMSVMHDRPTLIQGSMGGSLDFIHGGENDFFETVSAMVTTGAADDPPIRRLNIAHPLLPDPRHQYEYTPEVPSIFDILTLQLTMVIQPTERVIKTMLDIESTLPSVCKLNDMLDPREVHDWCLLILMMAALYPITSEKHWLLDSGKIFTEEFGFINPGVLSVRRAALMLIGPRGFVHGWGGPLPRIRREVLRASEISYVCPADWAPDTSSDGNSAYDSDSPGCDGDNSDPDFGGPRGIAPMRPAVTGVTSDSSDSSDDSNHLNIFPSGGPEEPESYKLMKRFVKYLKTSNKERRERRDIRQERRDARKKYNSQRRLAEPLFDLEARRAEALAAERRRNEINYQNLKDAREKEFIRIHRAVHKEVINEGDDVLKNSPEVQKRYKTLLIRVRAQIVKRWMEQSDRRIIDLQQELENNEEEMHFLSWMSPVHWVTQTGPNCGLAVLAMASRPVVACEVALDVSIGGHKIINDMKNCDSCNNQLKITKFKALMSEAHNMKTCCEITSPPLTIFPPKLMELQCEAVMNNYSSRGEMFSALAMGKLAYSHHVGQYKVHLVNRNLWNEYESKQLNKPQNDMEAINADYEKYFGIEEFDDNLSANYNDIDDMCEQKMDIDDVSISSGINDNFPSTDQEMSVNEENYASPSLLQQDYEFEEDFDLLYSDEESEESRLEHNQPKEKIDITDDCGVTVSPNNPLWKMSVVKHLMSGNKIAVCYDCDKNMKPSLENEGSTAHWALMCGVIVGKVYQKKKYDGKEDGFLYMSDRDTCQLKPAEFIARNDIIEGTANVGYLFDDPLRRIVSCNPCDTNADDDNIDFEADCVKDGGMEYDKYCGNVDSYKDIMHNVDLNNVWVVVQHGKNMGDYDVWNLDQVAKSNQQLRLPSEKILSCFWSWNDDEDTTEKLLQSLSAASLFGSKYTTSFVSYLDVLKNRKNNADQSLNLTLEQNQAGPSSIPPPPPPLPPTPSPVIMPKKDRPYLPFVLPEGVRLDNCLAQNFLVFKPTRSPYLVSNIKSEKFNLCPNPRRNPKVLDPLMFFFTFDANALGPA